MKAATLLALGTAACTYEGSVGDTAPYGGRVQVALVAPQDVQNHDLDLLFVIDDSPGMLGVQQSLVGSFPSFIDALAGLPAGLPNLHVAVVSSDMGTKGAADPYPGPGVGAGAGSCSSSGKNGLFATSAAIDGPFIADIANTTERTTNYTGTLAEAFASIASLGEAGCGFEQPLHAAEVSFSQPENAGFLRPGAKLAVIVVANEDDCSVARTELLGSDTATLGPLQSFRCTRFGVTCEQGGRTPDEMNLIGPKANCHANESVGYLTSVVDHGIAIRALEEDPRNVLFAAIAAESSSLEVELRTPPGGGTAIPAVKEYCPGTGASGTYNDGFAGLTPAVRLTDHAKSYPRGRVTTMCGGDVYPPLMEIAREVRGLLGDACLTRNIALPADCVAFDTRADGTQTPLPACSAATSRDCWELVADPGCAGQGQRVRINRLGAVPPDVMVSLRCRTSA